MKAYNHLLGYLHRWTLCKIGLLHVRLHRILSKDGTPFLHNHPFWYVSFVFSGGYTEQVLVDDRLVEKQHVAPAVIIRKASTYHRITDVKGVCRTLFFAYGNSSWSLRRHPLVKSDWDWIMPAEDGVYRREINGKATYSKFENRMWYVGSDSVDDAIRSIKLSVHQCGEWEAVDG